jgi:hypothetical protein
MITHKFVQNCLGQSSYRNLIAEIDEAQMWSYGYFSISITDSGAGFKYRTSYSAVLCEAMVEISEWMGT